MEKALAVAHAAMDRRLETMNEFRNSLRDQAQQYVTNVEHRALCDRMDRIDKANERRRFLAGASRIALGSAAAMATMGQLQMVHAATRSNEKYKALVCVYLFGGNDSFNMVVPRSASAYANYQAARPALSIAQANLLPITPITGGAGADWGLHPAMTEMQALFESGRAGLLANVGPLVAPTSKTDYQGRRVPLPPELTPSTIDRIMLILLILRFRRVGRCIGVRESAALCKQHPI
jgi:hypothetical protein